MRILIFILSICLGYLIYGRERNDPSFPDLEFTALKSFYYEAGGPDWIWNLTSGNPWNFTTDIVLNPCTNNWQGIACNCTFTVCHITKINLENHNLTGIISPSLYNLTQLTILDLANNTLKGSASSSVCSLPNSLVYLSLSFNDFRGKFPTCLWSLSNLQSLGLDYNGMNGNLPSFPKGLVLEVLSLNYNLFVGSIPTSIVNATQLKILKLSSNHLAGEIPSSLWELKELANLDISKNFFEGILSNNISNLINLQSLIAHSNYFYGSLPDALFNLTKLEVVYLQINHFSGTIPNSIGNLHNVALLFLDLNSLTGTIPPSLGDCISLRSFTLSYNYLVGNIPHTLSQQIVNGAIDLSVNALTGSVPGSIGTISRLTLFYFAENYLNGTIPSTFGYRKFLLEFIGFQNLLTGPIPHSFINSTHMKYFYVDNNCLNGTIPNLFSYEHHLDSFSISNNFISGSVPTSLANLINLRTLDVSSNQLIGKLPSEFGMLPNISFVNLSGNTFHQKLSTIQFRENSYIAVIDMAYNQFSGTIGFVFTPLRLVTSLLLSNNQLTGNLEHFLNVSTQLHLQNIDVSANYLTGTIPAEIFELPLLQTFAATKNCLERTLPYSTLCQAYTLQDLILDGLASQDSCLLSSSFRFNRHHYYSLSDKNNLGAHLNLDCLLLLPSLQSLHLSGNGYTGSLPDFRNGLYPNLTDLILSYNLLDGSIPTFYYDQNTKLTTIDFSYNRLQGILYDTSLNITMAMVNGTMSIIDTNTSLESLTLQVNRLSGLVPSTLFSIETINILRGNLFTCNYYQTNLPENDPDAQFYQCGSNELNLSLFIWVGFFGILLIVLLLLRPCFTQTHQHFHRSIRIIYRKKEDNLTNPIRKTRNLLHNIVISEQVIGYYRYLMYIFLIIIFLVFIPLSIVLTKMGSATYTYQYAYSVSFLFLQGTIPAVVMVLVSFLILGTCVSFLFCTKNYIHRPNMEQANMAIDNSNSYGEKEPTRPWLWTIVISIISFFNCLVVLIINIYYVKSLNSEAYSTTA
jgi:Leucine-rich repeat (LRR) protein